MIRLSKPRVEQLLMLLVVSLLVGPGLSRAQTDEIDTRKVSWLTFREAKAAGRDSDKPILLHFTAQYSPICKKMMVETYRDRHVIRYLNENFAAAMIDVEQLPALARKYKVETLPALWFLDARGKALTSIEGEVGPAKMLRVAEYISDRIYEHTDYDTWLERRHDR